MTYELISADEYADIYMASVEIDEVVGAGVNIHRLVHPGRGPIVAVQAGDAFFVAPGHRLEDRRDGMKVQPTGVVVPFGQRMRSPAPLAKA